MTAQQKYYPRLRTQWRPLLYIAVMFIVTVLYSLSLRNRTVGFALLLMSLVYPLVMLLTVLGSIPKLNYIELKADGIHTTSLGVIHKLISWESLKRIDPVKMSGTAVLAIEFNDSYDKRSLAMKLNKRLRGWDGMMPNAYRPDGTSLYEGLEEWHRKHFG